MQAVLAVGAQTQTGATSSALILRLDQTRALARTTTLLLTTQSSNWWYRRPMMPTTPSGAFRMQARIYAPLVGTWAPGMLGVAPSFCRAVKLWHGERSVARLLGTCNRARNAVCGATIPGAANLTPLF